MPSGKSNTSGSEKGGSGEEAGLQVATAPLPLPHHGRVEALLDDGPHREAGGEHLVAVVVADDQVGAVAGAELVDVVEELVGGVAGEHVGEAGLDTDAEQGEPPRRLPLRGPGELLVAELDADLLVGRVRVRRGQAHRHVEVVGARGERPGEDRHHEPRVHGVEDVGGPDLAGERGHCVGVGGVDLRGAEALLARTTSARRLDGALGPLDVVVGHHPGLEEVALDRDPGRGVTDATGTDHQHAHGSGTRSS